MSVDDIPRHPDVDDLADLVLVVDATATIRFTNAASRRILGCEPAAKVGTNAFDLVHPDDAGAAAESLFATTATGAGPKDPTVLRFAHADGTWVRLAMVANDLLDDPAVRGVVISGRVDRDRDPDHQAPEDQYRLIVEATEQGVWRIDRHGVTTFVNPQIVEMLGYTPEEMIGHHVFDFMDDDARVEASANLRRRPGGLRDRYQAHLRHALGHDVWVEIDSSPLTDHLGDYDGAITIITDITDQHHVDEALRRERERFRRLVQESSDIIVVATEDGAVDYASPAVEAILGFRPEELRGRPLTDLLLDPADGPALLSGALAPASSMGDSVPNEIKLRHRDGSPRYCEVVARDLTDDPSVRGVVVNARDVTEARRAERRLRALFGASNDIVTILQPDGNWFASPAGTRLLGHAPGYEPEGGLLSLVHPDDVERATVALTDALDGRRSGSDPLEFRARTADGSYRWLEAVANDLSSDPLVGGVVITARDITERRRHATELREAEAEQREAEARFREAFASSPVGIGFADLGGRLTWVNRALARVVGIPEPELRGMRFQDLSREDQLPEQIAETRRLLVGEIEAFETEMRYDHPDGRTVWGLLHVSLVRDAAGAPAQLLGQLEDVTGRKEQEDVLRHDAEHDALTGLWNRKGLRNALTAAWESRNPERPLALIFGDLNGFKQVNDQYGHDAGDQVLDLVSRRLGSAIRAGDTLARWGGDEFVVLCPSVAGVEEAKAVAERIRGALTMPFRIAEGPVNLGISLGVAVDTGEEISDALLKRADQAAYRAKRDGRIRVAIAP